MRIALDAMGGDHAPGPIVTGAVEAVRDRPDLTVVLVGDQERVEAELAQAHDADRDRLPIVHASQVIGMEEKPVEALRKKRDNSISKCWGLMAAGEVNAVVSAGHTGAMVASALMNAKMFLPGVRRPGIAAIFPSHQGPDRHHRRRRQHERQGRGPLPVRDHGLDLRRERPGHRRAQDRPAERRLRGRQGERADQDDPRPLPGRPATPTGSSATSRGATSTRGTPGSSSARGSSATSCSRRARGRSSSSSPPSSRSWASSCPSSAPRSAHKLGRLVQGAEDAVRVPGVRRRPAAGAPGGLHHLPRLLGRPGDPATPSGSPARWPRSGSTPSSSRSSQAALDVLPEA